MSPFPPQGAAGFAAEAGELLPSADGCVLVLVRFGSAAAKNDAGAA